MKAIRMYYSRRVKKEGGSTYRSRLLFTDIRQAAVKDIIEASDFVGVRSHLKLWRIGSFFQNYPSNLLARNDP